MTTDDLKDIPHVVIVESAAGIRIAEFERDTQPNPMLAAHDYAQSIAAGDFHGRVIVAAHARTLQPFAYVKECEAGKAPGSDDPQSGGKLSPFGRLRRIAPQILAEKRRLEWLIANSAYVAHARDGEVCWVMMRPDEESDFATVDNTTRNTARDSIDAAMRGPNDKLSNSGA